MDSFFEFVATNEAEEAHADNEEQKDGFEVSPSDAQNNENPLAHVDEQHEASNIEPDLSDNARDGHDRTDGGAPSIALDEEEHADATEVEDDDHLKESVCI